MSSLLKRLVMILKDFFSFCSLGWSDPFFSCWWLDNEWRFDVAWFDYILFQFKWLRILLRRCLIDGWLLIDFIIQFQDSYIIEFLWNPIHLVLQLTDFLLSIFIFTLKNTSRLGSFQYFILFKQILLFLSMNLLSHSISFIW